MFIRCGAAGVGSEALAPAALVRKVQQDRRGPVGRLEPRVTLGRLGRLEPRAQAGKRGLRASLEPPGRRGCQGQLVRKVLRGRRDRQGPLGLLVQKAPLGIASWELRDPPGLQARRVPLGAQLDP